MHQTNQDDRALLAHNLGLSLEKFDKLLFSANHAYDVIKSLGPFYGKANISEPTFRIAAEPVPLPRAFENVLKQFGSDFLCLGRILHKLPKKYKKMLGDNLEFRLPPTWRIDTILDSKGRLRVNEIEGVDGASALMVAEQLAYKPQDLPSSTAGKLISTLKAYTKTDGDFKIAIIWPNIETDPYIPNIKKFGNFLYDLSKKSVRVELFDEKDLRDGIQKPKWDTFGGVINESSLTLAELKKIGIKKNLIISAGFYNAIVNKGLFALIFEPKLNKFWVKEIGEEKLLRLQQIMIPTTFVSKKKHLEQAKKEGKVVKVSWAGTNISVMDRSKGVAIPTGNVKHNTEERWESLRELLKQDIKMIAQVYVEPGKIPTYLRKRGTTLEKVEWYNRICVKYVCTGDPNTETCPDVTITAVEVTLGPEVVPAGRECSFTAGMFVD